MAKQLELTARLQLLADWVPPGAKLADIGTDHGYLPVWLDLHGRVKSAIAGDLRKGPLERARENGAAWGAEHIDYRLGNGLECVSADEADTIVIAGMGGENIASILEAAPWTKDGNHTLLLSPHTKSEELRTYLSKNGYTIRREALVADRGTLYPVMEAAAGEMDLTLGQCWGGAKLLRDPLGDKYLIQRIVRLQTAVLGARKADPEKAEHLRKVITALMEMREEWRHANSR
jgi:tRNA (adenine22-N1)-methyltransferase